MEPGDTWEEYIPLKEMIMKWSLWSMTRLIILYQDPKVWLEEVPGLVVEMDVMEMVVKEREVMYDVM